jgi:hypothetical protein
MNFDSLFAWITAIVIAFAAAGKLDTLQRWVWTAQAKVVHDSRTSTWGSPRFFAQETKNPSPIKSEKQLQEANLQQWHDLSVDNTIGKKHSFSLLETHCY